MGGVAVGGSNIIVIGSYGGNQPTASAGITSLTLNGTNFVDLIDPTANEIVSLTQGANTIDATAGSSTIFSATGRNTYDGSGGNASLYFVGNAQPMANGVPIPVNGPQDLSRVTGGSGNATVFAANGVIYTEGSGFNVYVGGSGGGHSTVNGTSGHDLLFGGKTGDFYNAGGGNETYINGGGVDTITGGYAVPSITGAAAGTTVYGDNGGTDIMIETKSGTFVADGSNDVLDGSQAGAGNLFYALNAPGIGNATLIGSGTGNDKFAVESIAGGANLPHQITIQNFHNGDALFLENYSATDDQRLIQAVANGGSSFTLSDNTTVSFVGGHPTGAFNGGTIAI